MKYTVRIIRTSYSEVFLTVDAANETEAKTKAEVDAMNRYCDNDYEEYDSYLESEIMETFETQRIHFEHNDSSFYLSFTPEESDWWTSALIDGQMFDIHYDESDMTISVYDSIQDDNGKWVTNTIKSIYSTPIKK